MSTEGRFEDRVDQVSGKTKEWAGAASGDRDLEAEGKTQHNVADVKHGVREAGDKVKDAASDTAHKVKDTFRR